MSNHSFSRGISRSSFKRASLSMAAQVPLALALLHAVPAMAQANADEEKDSKEIQDAIVVVGNAAARDLTIGRTPLSIRETPMSVVVMDAGRIEDQNLRSLDDVLLQTPGVVLGADSSIENTYYARGHVIQSTQYDGMTTETAAEQIASPNMAMYEAVEVLLGSNGLLNGVNGFGSINLRRKRALDSFQFNGGVAGGSWDRYHIDADVTGPLDKDGKVRGRVVASYDSKQYFYPYADFKEVLLFGTLEADLTETTTLRVASHWQNTDAHPNTPGVPFYTDGGSIGLPRSTMLSPAWSRFRYNTKNAFVELNQELGSHWSIKGMFNYLDTKSSNNYAYYWGGIDRATQAGAADWMGLFFEQARFRLKQQAYDLAISGPLRFWGREHRVLLGINHQATRSFSTWAYPSPDDNRINIFDFDPASVPRPDWGTPEYYSPASTTQTGIFGQVALKPLDSLTVMLGGRVSWWETDSRGYIWGTNAYDWGDKLKLDSLFTPLVGLVWDFSKSWSAYASFTDYQTPQTARNRDGDLLGPMKATNYEVGIKGAFYGGRLTTSLAFFRLQEVNRAIADTAGPPNQGGATPFIAGGETRSDGIELQLNGQITSDWSMNFGYTYNTTKYVKADVDQGRPFATFTPKHLAKLWTLYRLPFDDGRMSVGLGIVAQSKLRRPLDDQWSVFLKKKGYIVADVRVTYRVTDNWTAGVNLNNIFDKKYYAGSVGSSADGNHFYGDPRNFMFTLRGKY